MWRPKCKPLVKGYVLSMLETHMISPVHARFSYVLCDVCTSCLITVFTCIQGNGCLHCKHTHFHTEVSTTLNFSTCRKNNFWYFCFCLAKLDHACFCLVWLMLQIWVLSSQCFIHLNSLQWGCYCRWCTTRYCSFCEEWYSFHLSLSIFCFHAKRKHFYFVIEPSPWFMIKAFCS